MIFTPHFLSHIAKSKFVENLRAGKIIIDNSEYVTWQSCFVQGLYNGALRRVGAKSRAPLSFGGAVHAGLESFFRGEETWRDAALADAAITELDALADPKRNTNKLMDLLESYCLEYPRNPSMHFSIVNIEGKPAVEQSFTVPLGEIDVTFEGHTYRCVIIWAGKIDLITDYEGALCAVDHKTTTVMGEKFADDKLRSSQMLGYTFALRYLSQHIFNNLPVFGVRINALAMRSAGFEFKQFDLPMPDWKVSEWQQETLLAIKDLVSQLDRFLATGVAAPTREHCVTKYGKCSYFDVCECMPKMRDQMIFDDSYYFITDWSPLNE